MGNTTSSCRGYGQGALVMFVVIFLAALMIAIIDWQAGSSSSCAVNLSRCVRVLMDIVLAVLSLAGILYLSALLARCKCEGSSDLTEYKLDVPEPDTEEEKE